MKRFGRFLLIFMTSAALLTVAVGFLEFSNQSPAHESNEPVESLTCETDSIRHTPPPDNSSEIKSGKKNEEPVPAALHNGAILGRAVSDKTGDIGTKPGKCLAGKVTAADTKKPLENVKVTLIKTIGGNKSEIKTVTKEDGTYNFNVLSGLEGKTVEILFSYAGYLPHSNSSYKLGSGSEGKTLDVELKRAQRITGKVTAEDTGKPLCNASVVLYLPDKGQELPAATGKTGDYKIASLPTGKAAVYIKHPEYILHVTASITITNDINILSAALRRGCEINGTVTGSDNLAIPGVTINCTPEDTSDLTGIAQRLMSAAAKSDGKGRFTLYGLEPGREYNIEACATNGYMGTNYRITPGDGHTNHVAFILNKASSVSGYVTSTDGERVKGATVRLRIREEVIDHDGAARTRDHSFSASTEKDGRYLMENLPAGTGSIEVVDGNYLPHRQDGFTLSPGTTDDRFDFTLKPTLNVSGIVIDSSGNPMNGTDIQIYQWGPKTVRNSTTTDETGRFNFSGFAEGWVYLMATVSCYEGTSSRSVNAGDENVVFRFNGPGRIAATIDAQKPADGFTVNISSGTYSTYKRYDNAGSFFEQTLPAGTYSLQLYVDNCLPVSLENINVFEGKTTDLHIPVDEGCAVNVRVTDSEDGTAAKYAWVELRPMNPDTGTRRDVPSAVYRTTSGSTGDEGEVLLSGLLPGTYAVIVTSGPNLQGWGGYVTLTKNRRLDLEVVLEPAASITGHVYGPDGKPVSNAIVRAELVNLLGGPLPKEVISRRMCWTSRSKFNIGPLQEGCYKITANISGNDPIVREIVVPGSGEVEFDFHFQSSDSR